MKHTTRFRFMALLLAVLFLNSCNQDDLGDFNSAEVTTVEQPSPEFTVLGKQNKIAFTVENMQRAYESLKQNKTAKQWSSKSEFQKSTNTSFSASDYQVTTTHKYYKFTPQDSLQYERLVNDSILAVSDIPFEYNIQTDGDKYQAPDMVGTDFTHYYSVVPVDYQIPTDIPHEEIADMHFTAEDEIPDDAPEYELQKVDFFHDLNTEALKISDNLEQEKEELLYLYTNAQGVEEKLNWQEAQNRGLSLNQLVINFNEDDYDVEAKFFRRRKWNPCGRVTMTEDAINNKVLGVAGAQIKVRKWGFLVFKTARTNNNGEFQTSSTRTKRVKYAVYFNGGNRFTVKAGTWFWNARHRGTRTYKRACWYQHFTGGRSHFYSFVQNAAHDYYSRVIFAYNLWWPHTRIFISAKYDDCNSSQTRPHWLPFTSHLRVTRKNGNCQYRGSDGIYATTVHELTHSAHRRHDGGLFSIFSIGSCNRAILIESYAEGVETIVTNDRYNNLFNPYNSRWNFNRQLEQINTMNEYTPIVADLIDNFNQQAIYGDNRPIDNVDGYTLNQIQNAIDNCRDVDCWENNLNNIRPNGVTTSELNQLFDYVRYVRYNVLKHPCY